MTKPIIGTIFWDRLLPAIHTKPDVPDIHVARYISDHPRAFGVPAWPGWNQLDQAERARPASDVCLRGSHAFPFHALYAWQSRPHVSTGTIFKYAAQATSSFVDCANMSYWQGGTKGLSGLDLSGGFTCLLQQFRILVDITDDFITYCC
jgi:hypothetical protein